MKKKILVLALAMIMACSLVACGGEKKASTKKEDKKQETVISEKENNDDDTVSEDNSKDNTEDNKEDSDSSAKVTMPDFGEVTIDNYIEVVKEHFGIDLSEFVGSVRYAKTGNSFASIVDSKNVKVAFDLPEGTNYKEELKKVVDQTLALSNGTVWKSNWSIDDNGDAYNCKGNTSFSSFDELWQEKLDNALIEVDETRVCSAGWVYDFGGYTIYIYAEIGLLNAELEINYHCKA